jgi:hypothetical protein
MSEGIAAHEDDRELSPAWGARRQRPALLALLTAILAFGGTLLLYRDALQLPFLFDDMIHLRWLDGQTLGSIWIGAEGLGYYRPLTMSIWKVEHLLLNSNDPFRLHLLNLLLHAVNASLTGYAAWRACTNRGRWVYTLLATTIFVTFPFSFQAVPSTSSLSKPLIGTLTLVSVLLYWEARRRQSRGFLGFSLLIGLLAPFAYESGVMVPLAIVAVEVLGYSRQEFQRPHWLPILHMVLIWGIVLPLVILMEPEGGAPLRIPSLLMLWQNGVYFVQGLVFPIAPLATHLEQALGVDEYTLVAVLSLIAFIALFAFYRWVKQTRLFLYALSWFAVGVVPLWLMLDFSYVITSPRLLYLGAVGSALQWAGIPVWLWLKLPTRRWVKVVAVAGAIGMLGFGIVYVQQRMTLAREVAEPLWQAAEAAVAHGASSELLYVNVPAWVAPKEPIYRIGTEGLTFIPEYVRVQDFAYVTTGVEPRIRSVVFDPAKQDWKAYIGYAGSAVDWNGLAKRIRRVEAVYVTTYPSEGLRFSKAGDLEESVERPDTSTAPVRFGDAAPTEILLLDAQSEPSNEQLVLHLWWYCQAAPGQDITVLVHVYDEQGQLVAQGDGYPLLGLFPPVYWQPGDLVHDIRYIPLPVGIAGRSFTTVAGWYDTATGERLPSFDDWGQPLPQDTMQVFP